MEWLGVNHGNISVTAVTWGPNRLDVFGLGLDYDVHHSYWSVTQESWSDWVPLDRGPFTSPPTAISTAPESIDLFALGTDHGVWHSSLTKQGKWTAWESLNMTSTSTVGVCSWTTGTLDVFTIGIDSAAWHVSWNGSAWSGWESLGGVFDSSISGLCFSANNIELFGLGSDSIISSAGVTAATGTLAVTYSSLTIAVGRSPSPTGGQNISVSIPTSIREGSSPGATGGITGDVLGAALLFLLAVIICLIKRQKKTRPGSPEIALNERDFISRGSTRSASVTGESVQVGGRLKYSPIEVQETLE